MRDESDAALLQRYVDFQLEILRNSCESARRHHWGYACLNPSIPLVWDANLVIIDQQPIAPSMVIAIADEVLGGAGLDHRTVIFGDPLEGERAAEKMRHLGFEGEHLVHMVLRADDVPAKLKAALCGGIEVTQPPRSERVFLRRALIRADIPPLKGLSVEELVNQLIEWDHLQSSGGNNRWFVAAPPQGEPASACRLLRGSGFGQVEDVVTLGEQRQNGLAKAVTLAAAAASIEEGHEHTFISALADDWPRVMYANLGFVEIGETRVFRRRPDSF